MRRSPDALEQPADGSVREPFDGPDTAAAPADALLGRTILVGDADMLFDHFALRQMQSPFGTLSMAMNGNLNFAQNAMEQLTAKLMKFESNKKFIDLIAKAHEAD